MERYSLMAATLAATLASHFPDKAPELFAYQATVIRAERNYETGRWVSYNRQFLKSFVELSRQLFAHAWS
jgi:hypothetical protein